ncbi:D-arabinono-1,4-lactone oxidase [Paraconexibacter algicola]|uniref:Oxidoreductase n=1 Tax=Paraconexibacter algicola TaxID=2133960 RepID=A0A2T4UBG9_9ACTN|nr:D-arabinono-1,4-lactone oxidase [Paraconexibacter algicola]PTL54244.1 oxidoreductase [Paraconexibacter algicola]
MSETWTSWSQEHTCRPAVLARPTSVAEVQRLVREAAAAGRVVRVAGAGHSFTPCVVTDGTLLSLERMSRVLDVDREAGLVRVEAGITLNACSEALAAHGLAFENLGDIDVQSIAGATATGTHGTGARLRNLSSALHAIELVRGDGEVVELDEASDPDGWRAARVSLGALGVVTAVTVRVVPAFTLRGVDTPMPLAEVLPRLDELADGSEHFEFFTFPHSPLALTRTNTRTTEPPRPRSRAAAFVQDELLVNRAFGVANRVARARPSWIPAINRLVSRASGTSVRVDRSDRIFASPRSVRFTEMEYAIPREHGRTALERVRALVQDGGHAVSFPFEVRFVAGDDAFLSPAGGRDTCYIASHVFEGMPWEPFLRGVEGIMRELDGRPHWGKRHFRTAEDLRPVYPDFDRFLAVRDRLDPGRVFTNPYVAQVLGP